MTEPSKAVFLSYPSGDAEAATPGIITSVARSLTVRCLFRSFPRTRRRDPKGTFGSNGTLPINAAT